MWAWQNLDVKLYQLLIVFKVSQQQDKPLFNSLWGKMFAASVPNHGNFYHESLTRLQSAVNGLFHCSITKKLVFIGMKTVMGRLKKEQFYQLVKKKSHNSSFSVETMLHQL